MGKFEIKKDNAGEFRFNLKSGNGQVILSSEGYKAKPSCINGIESVRNNSQADERFERKQTPTGHKFNLKSSNGQIVGTSEVYTTSTAMEKGILSVTKNAPAATVNDLS
ncbi:MAG TPA: YegP family protein [Salinimicrobium sp.]|nr:YegP family protein [Salinimicrobium sp.]